MDFNPDSPAKPQDLTATFDINNQLSGLLYNAPDGNVYSRVNGEWLPSEGVANPVGMGAGVVFVSPDFIMEYDSRMMYREYIPSEQVQAEFGVQPDFGFDPFSK